MFACPGTAARGEEPAVLPHEVEDDEVYIIKGKPDRVCKACRRRIQRRYERKYELEVRARKERP